MYMYVRLIATSDKDVICGEPEEFIIISATWCGYMNVFVTLRNPLSVMLQASVILCYKDVLCGTWPVMLQDSIWLEL